MRKFERNASVLSQPDKSLLSDLFANDTDSEEFFPLFAANNADHQIQILHGKGTFHGMGIIPCITPSRKVEHIVCRNMCEMIIFEKGETIIY